MGWGVISLVRLVIWLELASKVHHALSDTYLEPGPKNDEEEKLDHEENQDDEVVVVLNIIVHDLLNLLSKWAILVNLLAYDNSQVAFILTVIKVDTSWHTCLNQMVAW